MGVVILLNTTGTMLSFSILTHITLGRTVNTAAVVTVHMREKLWPALVEPVVDTVTSGGGRTEEKIKVISDVPV